MKTTAFRVGLALGGMLVIAGLVALGGATPSYNPGAVVRVEHTTLILDHSRSIRADLKSGNDAGATVMFLGQPDAQYWLTQDTGWYETPVTPAIDGGCEEDDAGCTAVTPAIDGGFACCEYPDSGTVTGAAPKVEPTTNYVCRAETANVCWRAGTVAPTSCNWIPKVYTDQNTAPFAFGDDDVTGVCESGTCSIECVPVLFTVPAAR